MKVHLTLILFICTSLLSAVYCFSQTKQKKAKVAMKETDSPISSTIQLIPTGSEARVINHNGAKTKIECIEKNGYAKEVCFESGLGGERPQTKEANNIKISTSELNCEEILDVPTPPKPEFVTFLSGVKYAVITNKPQINGHVPAFNALYEFLQNMGFEVVQFFNDSYVEPNNLCDAVEVEIYFDYDLDKFSNIRLRFVHESGYSFNFSSNQIVKSDFRSDVKYNFYNVLRGMYGYKKNNFSNQYRLELPKKITCWNEEKLRSYFTTKSIHPYEGIYENFSPTSAMAKYRIAVKKIKGDYYLVYLSGAPNPGNWTEGEVKARLEPTATPLFFKAHWITSSKRVEDNVYVSLENNLIRIINNNVKEENIYIKMFPQTGMSNEMPNISSSGTGYAISQDGYIVTNCHVVKDVNTIKVRGLNGNFSKTYSAKIIIEDKSNDICLLKIDDSNFTSIVDIPYTLSSNFSEVGTPIYVLGYPLRSTMGDEVKLTNGIVSSKSGYQGELNAYQITAAVQPGNSGGPLFDYKGNIIGTINAKHTGAENASYAIKAKYLYNLINSLPNPPKITTYNKVNGMSFTEQVKAVKKFVYIIEAY